MTTSVKILEHLTASNFHGIDISVTDYLKDVLDNVDDLSLQKTKCYDNFVVKFLHTVVSKLKTISDEGDIQSILAASQVCCKAHVNMRQINNIDKTYTVPKLIYHIVNHFRSKDYIEDMIVFCEFVYTMFECDLVVMETEASTIIFALFGCVWNTTLRLLPHVGQADSSSVTLVTILRLRRCCVLFLCLLPDRDGLIDRLKSILSHFFLATKDEGGTKLDVGGNKILVSIFESVINHLTKCCNANIADLETNESKVSLVQIKALYVEHLLKFSNYKEAKSVAKSIKIDNSDCAQIVCNIYKFAIACNESSLETADEVDNTIGLLGNANERTLSCLDSFTTKELTLLYGSYHFLTHLKIMSVTDGSKLTPATCDKLLQCCETFVKIIKKKEVTNGEKIKQPSNIGQDKSEKGDNKKGSKGDNSSDRKEDKRSSDEKTVLLVSTLLTYYRQLQLIWHAVKSHTDTSSDYIERCLDTAKLFHQHLETQGEHLQHKTLYAHRYNCGYYCKSLGKFWQRQGMYDVASVMYDIAIVQLHACQQPNVTQLFECLVECNLKQDKWLEGTKVVLQSMAMLSCDFLSSTAALWVMLKNSALHKQVAIFETMDLLTVYKTSGLFLPGVTDKLILVEEFQQWKKLTSRQYEIEFEILRELCGVPQSDVELSEWRIELAINMYLTGHTYKQSTSGEILNKAIVALDKSTTGCKALLALAYYTKYVITHEETINKLTGNITNMGDNSCDFITQYTLQSEEEYLPFLSRAIDLWENCLGACKNKMSPNGKKNDGKKNTKKQSPQKQDINDKDDKRSVPLVKDIGQHIDALILCGTRLLVMKQPTLAWRALKVAKCQLHNISDTKQAADLTMRSAHVLMLLGRYNEARSLLDQTQILGGITNKSLLQAELYLLTGQKEEGMCILNTVLGSQTSSPMTEKYRLIDGTAKRLLSMFLCFPDSHINDISHGSHEYLISLAYEAVHNHITVLKYVTKARKHEKNADKWMLLYEVLQSLLHVCQLYRLIGLPRWALCFLREGLQISQAEGLPRWSCEFLFEILRARSMEADWDKAIVTIDSINRILTVTGSPQSTVCEYKNVNQSNNQTENDVIELDNQSDKSDVPVAIDCFGFEELSIGPKTEVTETITPEKDEKEMEMLDSGKKSKMSKLEVPDCTCIKKKLEKCDDPLRHRLCMSAGIVLAEFLALSGMRNVAERLLGEMENKFKLTENHINSRTDRLTYQPETCKALIPSNGLVSDPQTLLVCLEASCVQAEFYLHQKQYEKVNQIWATLLDWEKTGALQNVLHSNIMMARLALCGASSHILSLQTGLGENIFCKNQSITGSDSMQTVFGENAKTSYDSVRDDFEKLSLMGKKVEFGDDCKQLAVEGVKMKGARRKLLKDKSCDISAFENYPSQPLPATPLRLDIANKIMASPDGKMLSKMIKSSKKQRIKQICATPLSSRKVALDLLMESDEEEDNVTFPNKKMVTPKVVKNDKVRQGRSKTEPRNSKLSKSKSDTLSNQDPVCKLELILESGDNDNTEITEINNEVDQSSEDANIHASIEENRESEKAVKRKRGSKLPLAVNKRNDVEENTELIEKEESNTTKSKVKGKKTANQKLKKVDTVDNSNKENNKVCDIQKGTKQIDEHKTKSRLKMPNMKVDTDSANVKGDVFDFDLEASPDIPKVTKACKKGKSKISKANNKKAIENEKSCKEKKQTKKASKTSKSKLTSDDKSLNENLESELTCQTKVSKPRTTRGSRTTRQDVEVVRRERDTLLCNRSLSISYEDLESDGDVDNNDITEHEISLDTSIPTEPIIDKLTFESLRETLIKYAAISSDSTPSSPIFVNLEGTNVDFVDSDLSPIEIMRGDTRPKKLTRNAKKESAEDTSSMRSKKSTRTSLKEVAVVTTSSTRSPCAVMESDTGTEVETMRSGRVTSIRDITEKMNNFQDVTVSASTNAEDVMVSTTNNVHTKQETNSLRDSAVVSALESEYNKIRHFAPYPQHPNLCQLLALHYLKYNPQRAAFLLSDSIAVTFRHQAMLNVANKVRKKTKVQEQSVSRKSVDVKTTEDLASMKDGLLFDKNETHLQSMLTAIPQDWIVVQLSVVSAGLPQPQFILTRFVHNQSPVVIHLPGYASGKGEQLLDELRCILEGNLATVKIEAKAEWWEARKKLDTQMQTFVENVETYWLGLWRCAFLPRTYTQDTVTDVCSQINMDIDHSLVEFLLIASQALTEDELHQCTSQLLRSQYTSTDLEHIIMIIQKIDKFKMPVSDRHHVILILDKAIQHLPWECIPVLCETSVSRMPCLSHLYTQLNYLHAQESSVFNRGVNPSSTYYIVNPDSNLERTEKNFKSWFESEPGWEGVCGSRPTMDQFTDAVSHRDLLVYCGHGSGGHFLMCDEIEKLSAQAATILMGCSSGKLQVKGQLEPSGMMISYFLAGCPCMIANLWDVTDKDIDKYTVDLLRSWLGSKDGTYLPPLVQKSRRVCKMKYLVGSAPVVYGLPVFINRKGK